MTIRRRPPFCFPPNRHLRHRWLYAFGGFTALLLFPLCLAATMPENLLKNGDMEQGKGKAPKGWGEVDGLTSLWVQEGNPGKCILLDTTVLLADKKAYKKNPEKFQRSGGKGGTYDVVGATEGAWAFAPPYDVQAEDDGFILSCDVLGTEKSGELMYPMVLVRGFQRAADDTHSSWFHEHYGDGVFYSEQFGSEAQRRSARAGDWLMTYRHTLACRIIQPGKWQHFEMGFTLPRQKKYRPERLLFKTYAMWPAGKYRFDNLSLRRATREEILAVNARRPSIRLVVP